jgi:hypothetical protein
MKRKHTITWPEYAVTGSIAVGIVYDWKVGVLAFLALGIIYTLGGGK